MYIGYFQDIDENNYTVKIIPARTESTTTEIALSANPVVITQKSDGLFSEIKPLGCTIEILSAYIYPDMYATNERNVEVIVYADSTVIFEGYLTPYVYDQPYANVLDTIQLEAVSKLSTLKDIDYRLVSDEPKIVSFKDLLWHLFIDGAGYSQDTLKIYYTMGIENRLSFFKISEANFFDNDDAHTPWKMEEVLSQICRYLGVTCVEYNGAIYIIDYQHISKANNSLTLNYFDNTQLDDTNSITYQNVLKTITKDDYASNDSTISFDDIYNKVSVDVNTYNIEDLCPKIEELQYSTNISGYPVGTEWTHTEYKWNGKVKDSYKTYHQYHTIRLLNANSNWKHRYFKIAYSYSGNNPDEINTGSYISNPYYDPTSTTKYNNNVWPHINTRCAFIERFTYYDADDPTPSNLSWDTYIGFNCLDDTITALGDDGVFNVNTCKDALEAPVLEYTSKEPLRYSANTGTSWITFKGQLWYQRNTYQNDTAYTIASKSDNTYMYTPTDGILDVAPYYFAYYSDISSDGFNKGKKIVKSWPTRKKTNPDYGKGYPMLKCKLQIGNKFWDGSKWTTKPEKYWDGSKWVYPAEPTFYINFNNSPKNGEDEGFACFQWQEVAPNFDFTSKISDKCWAIPIKTSDNISGIMKFTIYTPSQFGPVFDGTNYTTNWKCLCPVIFMKGFELNYIYTDTSEWYLKEEAENDDIVYTNEVDAGFSREYDDSIEMKINTYTDNVPISRSFVMTGDNNEFTTKYINSDTTPTARQPEYLLIEKMLNHYTDKKLIYETSIKYKSKTNKESAPFYRYEFDFDTIDTFKDNGKNKSFVMDSFTHDVANNLINIKFIEW